VKLMPTPTFAAWNAINSSIWYAVRRTFAQLTLTPDAPTPIADDADHADKQRGHYNNNS